jgi:ATP-dependent 26S proteasome regulatory subunit
LTTNSRSALDPSFLRRLRFVITFGMPGVAERQSIWKGAFPSSVPTLALDFARLARLNLNGGSIRNVSLNAAFRAAAAGRAVTTDDVIAAAREEYHKLDRLISESDFRSPTENGAPRR